MTLVDLLAGGLPGDARQCSRARCSEAASTAIHWRNPKIHALDRVKTWLACEEHLAYLEGFLRDRSFPLHVLPIAQLSEPVSQETRNALEAGR